jgi:hypothetical protein
MFPILLGFPIYSAIIIIFYTLYKVSNFLNETLIFADFLLNVDFSSHFAWIYDFGDKLLFTKICKKLMWKEILSSTRGFF